MYHFDFFRVWVECGVQKVPHTIPQTIQLFVFMLRRWFLCTVWGMPASLGMWIFNGLCYWIVAFFSLFRHCKTVETFYRKRFEAFLLRLPTFGTFCNLILSFCWTLDLVSVRFGSVRFEFELSTNLSAASEKCVLFVVATEFNHSDWGRVK